MSKYRHHLPLLDPGVFLSDGGLETTLIFHDGYELPHFAAFDLLKDEEGLATLARYYDGYAELARASGTGFVLETPTWRASADWGQRLGYDAASLAQANRRSVDLVLEVRERFEAPSCPFVVSGNVGPRGDGYRVEARMTVDQARRYHATQIETFAQTHADLVTAVTLNYVDEAIGIVLAARDAGIPIVISFTTEVDGRLPSGETLAGAISKTDAATRAYPTYYMINCAHPTHFERELRDASDWTSRVSGVRANASKRSHAELDASPDLDAGDPDQLAGEYRALRTLLPKLSVYGGCCGTDLRHLRAISRHLLP